MNLKGRSRTVLLEFKRKTGQAVGLGSCQKKGIGEGRKLRSLQWRSTGSHMTKGPQRKREKAQSTVESMMENTLCLGGCLKKRMKKSKSFAFLSPQQHHGPLGEHPQHLHHRKCSWEGKVHYLIKEIIFAYGAPKIPSLHPGARNGT